MTDTQQKIQDYLAMSGQTEQDLFAGAQAFGYQFITDTLIPEALRDKKRIVWDDLPEKGIGAMDYSFEQVG